MLTVTILQSRPEVHELIQHPQHENRR